MSTFYDIRPETHATKKTTFVRLDNDDFFGTVRVEDVDKDNPGTNLKTDYQFNFSGIDTNEVIRSGRLIQNFGDIIEYVEVVKKGQNEVVNIGLKFFYPENQPHLALPAGYYWYNPKTHYDPSPILRAAKSESTVTDTDTPKTQADDPEFPGGSQFNGVTNGIIIYSEYDNTLGAIPTAVTTARTTKSYRAADNLFTQLANTDNRRTHIKANLLNILQHPEFEMWLGSSVSDTINDNAALLAFAQRRQGFLFWLEMMAQAVSIDSNLNTLQKFNLLNGESEIPGSDLASKLNNTAEELGDDRSLWTFHRLGTMGAAPNYKHSKPTGNTYPATEDTTITLSGANVGDSWVTYIRSI